MAILIIEDDISILRGLKDNLSFEGYQVITATDGREGLTIALEKQVDLLLLDIMLPGMNGYEICRKLKKEKRSRYRSPRFPAKGDGVGHRSEYFPGCEDARQHQLGRQRFGDACSAVGVVREGTTDGCVQRSVR